METNTTEDREELIARLNLQRKAAITMGGAVDHAGHVKVQPMAGFDLNRTIFKGLEGIARKAMHERLARELVWDRTFAAEIEAAYAAVQATQPAPKIDERLVRFMKEECDFSMEHADGSFLEHLVFCHDYAARHYPGHSPNVALLHSILGTATNTFAMEADKLPRLKALLSEFEAIQVEAFPSVLRLFYTGLLDELERNLHRLDKLKALQCHRVIDNEPLRIDADNLWINLNYHLMHFVDFMPSANRSTHRSDPLLQMFERLSSLLDRAGQRQARVEVSFPNTNTAPLGETRTLFGQVSDLLLTPAVKLKLTRKSIRKYSEQCGHDLSYQLEWAD
ncbi:hypothetical protein [Azoarcus taiwanensis]|uniref:Uncharacterized protein n=1 Tax=Azoarcus taiwanensis TaxID=666964 RepID=A0A972JAV0_9RHOO|nr:hypothetical protein [Azoarcus taiwanensis]NMG02797.1 hypothetical protein [Azoarcus taiwanensis]